MKEYMKANKRLRIMVHNQYKLSIHKWCGTVVQLMQVQGPMGQHEKGQEGEMGK